VGVLEKGSGVFIGTLRLRGGSVGFLEIWFAQNADDVDASPGPFEYNPVVAGSQTIEAFLEPL